MQLAIFENYHIMACNTYQLFGIIEPQNKKGGSLMAQQNETTERKANRWVAILYADSLRPSWLKLLERYGVACSVSPLHDKDVFTAEEALAGKGKAGHLKKAHYHLIICYKGPKYQRQVKAMLDECCKASDAPLPFPMESEVEDCEKYLTHETEACRKAGKHVYDADEVIHLNGYKVEDYPRKKKSKKVDVAEAMFHLMDLCEQYDLQEVWDVLVVARGQGYEDVIELVGQKAYLVKSIIDSRRYKRAKIDGMVNELTNENRNVEQSDDGTVSITPKMVWVGDALQGKITNV